MSRVAELIEQHCPSGVKFVPIGNAIRINFGARITKAKDLGTLYPVYGGGGESFLTDKYNREDDYVISRFAISSQCVRKVHGKFWMLDSGFTFEPTQLVDKDFVAQVLFNMQPQIYACSTKGAQKNLKTDEFKKIPIPVPPIDVQREIVRVLDEFSALESDLQTDLDAERTARQAQYTHYRDILVAFPVSEKVRRAPLGEIGFMYGGLTGKSKADFSDGNARFVSYVNVYNNIAVNTAANDFVRVAPGERQRSLQRGDVLFTGSSETTDEVAMSSVVTADISEPLYLNSFCIGFRLHDPASFDPSFSKHLFRSGGVRKQLLRTASGVTRFNVSKARLAKVEIPIPELKDQRRIATILDEFAGLVLALSGDLSAEMEARRVQYEHYRDRLLTFEEAAA